MKKKYPCPCCTYLTLTEFSSSSYEICPVCYWENDDLQETNSNLRGGANKESLKEAQKNFKKFGAVSNQFLKNVRPPHPEEIP